MSQSRGYLTPRQWREMFEAQGQRCCVAGCESDGPFEAEHSTPNAFEAGKPDQIMCKRHHDEKTRRDRKAIAKANRLSGRVRSKWNGDKPVRKIQSRPMSRKTARTRDEIMGVSNG